MLLSLVLCMTFYSLGPLLLWLLFVCVLQGIGGIERALQRPLWKHIVLACLRVLLRQGPISLDGARAVACWAMSLFGAVSTKIPKCSSLELTYHGPVQRLKTPTRKHVPRLTTSPSFWLGLLWQCFGRAALSTTVVGTLRRLRLVPRRRLFDVLQTMMNVVRRLLASPCPTSMSATSAVALCVLSRAGGCGLFQGTATTLIRPLAYRVNWSLKKECSLPMRLMRLGSMLWSKVR